MAVGGVTLIAEDVEDEVFIYQRAITKLGIPNVHIVRDGSEVIEYLQGTGRYADRNTYPVPRCLWLDIKMPKMTGFDVLRWMKQNPNYKVVPTIIMTNSNVHRDIEEAYELGANCFFQKPRELSEMIDLVALIDHFWKISLTPDTPTQGRCT
jgi:CheY-like chemotaxis protein